jgi:hypothetical protein
MIPFNAPTLGDLVTLVAENIRLSGHWTRICRLNFPQDQYPVAHIDFGTVRSDGEREQAIGTASVYRDGRVVTRYHL